MDLSKEFIRNTADVLDVANIYCTFVYGVA